VIRSIDKRVFLFWQKIFQKTLENTRLFLVNLNQNLKIIQKNDYLYNFSKEENIMKKLLLALLVIGVLGVMNVTMAGRHNTIDREQEDDGTVGGIDNGDEYVATDS
jgi:hypothetical protein